MTVPSPVAFGENGFEGLKLTCLLYFYFPSFICPLFQCVVMKLTKVLPSFTRFSSVCVRSIWSSFPPPSSPSILYLCQLMQLTANLSSSDSFFLMRFHSPSLLLFPSNPLLYFYLLSSLSPSVASLLISFPLPSCDQSCG